MGCATRTMKTLFAIVLLAASPSLAATTVSGVPIVVDGDGLQFGELEVRLQGIAAPEDRANAREPGGVESTANLRSLVGDNVECFLDGTQTRGRPVGVCYGRGGRDLGLKQVESGHARDCPRYSNGRYAKAEEGARAAGKDLSRIYSLPEYCGSDINRWLLAIPPAMLAAAGLMALLWRGRPTRAQTAPPI